MSTSIGQQLRHAREERSITIEQAAQSTRIRAHYLRAMEAGEFNILPSVAQVRGFLRAYASYLNLDPDSLLAVLDGKEFILSTLSPSMPVSPARPSTGGALPPSNTLPPGSTLPPNPPEAAPKGYTDNAIPQQDVEIFAEIGRILQRQRELLGLSLDEVERHTHLRQHYLKALEAGDLENLPSPVQGRGMLNNYATFLGLNSETLLLRFADGLQARLAAKQAAQPVERLSPPWQKPALPRALRRLLSGDVLIGGTLALFLTVFVVWAAIRIFAMSTEQNHTPTAPSIADVLLASLTPSDTPTQLPSTPTSPPPPQLFTTQMLATLALTGTLETNPQAGIQVYVAVNQRAWMRVTVDGKIEFEGRVLPGSAYPFIGETQVEILTGNGAALQVIFNGVDLGRMGNFGQVVNRIYNQQGVLIPTPTITPTPTATQPILATPVMTAVPGATEATAPPLP